jgi:hypothetical protein
MGREIRRVPPDWKHPTRNNGSGLQPLFDKAYEPAAKEWAEACALWERGEHPDQLLYPDQSVSCKHWWEWDGNPPDKEYCRPDWPAETITAYQVYETVSEGTPVSPVFATEEEMITWLAEVGAGMGIGGTPAPLGREGAERWVRSGGWAPSGVFCGGQVMSGVEFLALEKKD